MIKANVLRIEKYNFLSTLKTFCYTSTDNRNPNRGMNVNPDSDIFTFSDNIGSQTFLREERNFGGKSVQARSRLLFGKHL